MAFATKDQLRAVGRLQAIDLTAAFPPPRSDWSSEQEQVWACLEAVASHLGVNVEEPKQDKGSSSSFNVGEKVIMHSPHTDEDTEIQYRGKIGEEATVISNGMQITVPMAWLRKKSVSDTNLKDKLKLGPDWKVAESGSNHLIVIGPSGNEFQAARKMDYRGKYIDKWALQVIPRNSPHGRKPTPLGEFDSAQAVMDELNSRIAPIKLPTEVTSAGIALVKDGKVLLVHPTNASWYGTYSLPKGHVDPGEDEKAAALRETAEEVGVKVTEDMLLSGPYTFYIGKKRVVYWVADGTTVPDRIPKKSLQTEEVDWAGFLTPEEAAKRIHPAMKQVLDHA